MNRLYAAILVLLLALTVGGMPASARGHGGYHSSSRSYSPRSYSPRYHAPHHRSSRSYYDNGYQGGRRNGSRSPRTQWYSKYARSGGGHSHHGRPRSLEAKHEFWAMTGHPHGWPGHIVDHVIPLACGGADSPSNMQWQTTSEGKAKDKWERRSCRRHR